MEALYQLSYSPVLRTGHVTTRSPPIGKVVDGLSTDRGGHGPL